MHIDKNLQFISDKILDTRVALLHCYSNSLLKLPNTIVNTIRVDADGYIWFYILRPPQLLSQFDNEFPVTLNYFKKGNSYSLQILGKASLIYDADELIEPLKLMTEEEKRALATNILFKVKIIKVDFFDLDVERNQNLWGRVKSAMLNLLHWGEPDARTFEFS
ncbi:MAG: hypothetical protein JWQ96_3100 [Segetibacter sp.]|nr:hypothetical protein [Segetibacter sp.]